jgi:hypothetical protein
MDVNEVADLLQSVKYKRCGKLHDRKRLTVLSYAKMLHHLYETVAGESAPMTDLTWTKTRCQTICDHYDAEAGRPYEVCRFRKHVRELTALRAAAEFTNDVDSTHQYSRRSVAFQNTVAKDEEQQCQTESEKESFKTFDELRENAEVLWSSTKSDRTDKTADLRFLLYELMVPADASYALRRDARSLRVCDPLDDDVSGNFVDMTTGCMVFNDYKTSKYKGDDESMVSICLSHRVMRHLQRSLRTFPRKWLFPNRQDSEGMDQATFGKLIDSCWVLDDRRAPKCGNIRSALITKFMNGKNNKRPSLLAVKQFARNSMTSPAMMELVYHKVDVSD